MSSVMQRRDKIIPWYFVMFFAVVFIVNGILVHFALHTHTGVVTEHPYEKGIAYNKIIAAEQKQEALGWKSDLTYSDGVLHFTLRDKSGQLLKPEKATAIITRPTSAHMDFTVALKGADTRVEFPAQGLWEVRVEALVKGEAYQQGKRIVIQ